MLILRAEIFRQFSHIDLGFSTKIGLKRSTPYHFNLSLAVGDSAEIVTENRTAFYQQCGLLLSSVAMQKQVHEDAIRFVEDPGFQGESDAMITDRTGIGLAVSTADCVPVFIYCHDKQMVAAIHSGWRSTALKITQKTVQKLFSEYKCSPQSMYVYIGPSISQKYFEVGPEVAEQFPQVYSYPRGEKFHLDLIAYNKDMLLGEGVPDSQVQVTNLCSFHNHRLFHSYRREGFTSGRAYGVICLKSKYTYA